MKKNLLSIFAMVMLLLVGLTSKAQVRYFAPVFENVNKISQVWYDSNYSVNLLFGVPGLPPSLNGSPVYMASQFVDIYEPAGDTEKGRPLIILAHTGSYLPAFVNQQTTGNKEDSAIIEVAKNLAKRGYVVALASYRSGWNPATTIQAVAREQLLKATYRGLQDMRACVRYFKNNAATYGIDTGKVVIGGQGTGGYIALAYATVSTREDIESNIKFLRDDASAMVSMDTMGDWRGVGGIPPFNLPHPESVSSQAHMVINYGGAMGDIAWMKSTSLPIVSCHAKGDQFAPYFTGNVLVPTTGAVVIPNASGAGHVVPKADSLGLNNAINKYFYLDPITERAAEVNKKSIMMPNNNFGFETSFPFEGSPWEWWDRTAAQTKTSQVYRGIPLPVNGRNADSLSMLTNPFMSATRGKAYCDTVASFFAPRIAARFGLEGANAINAFNLLTPANNASLTITEEDTTLVSITWEPTSGDVSYALGLKLAGNNPFFYEEEDLPTNQLAVPAGDLYTLFKTGGFPDNTPTAVEWAVAAVRPTVGIGRNANSLFTVNVTLKPKGVGVKEAELNKMLIVYPNPATNDIKVTLNDNNAPMSEIVILDIMGREVYSATNLSTFSQQINLNGLNKGIYFATIKTTNGGAATQRFLVQ